MEKEKVVNYIKGAVDIGQTEDKTREKLRGIGLSDSEISDAYSEATRQGSSTKDEAPNGHVKKQGLSRRSKSFFALGAVSSIIYAVQFGSSAGIVHGLMQELIYIISFIIGTHAATNLIKSDNFSLDNTLEYSITYGGFCALMVSVFNYIHFNLIHLSLLTVEYDEFRSNFAINNQVMVICYMIILLAGFSFFRTIYTEKVPKMVLAMGIILCANPCINYFLHDMINAINEPYINSIMDYLSTPRKPFSESGISFVCPSNWSLTESKVDKSGHTIVRCTKLDISGTANGNYYNRGENLFFYVTWINGSLDLSRYNVSDFTGNKVSLNDEIFSGYQSKKLTSETSIQGVEVFSDSHFFNCGGKAIMLNAAIGLDSNTEKNRLELEDVKKTFQCG